MAYRKLFENIAIDSSLLDVSTWPSVLLDSLSDKDRHIFLKRKRAIDMYMNPKYTIKNIVEETGIHKQIILRYVRKCLSLDHNGMIWGYRALIPYKTIKTYTRRKSLINVKKFTGSFQMLLSNYPSIKKILDEIILKTKHSNATDPIIKPKFIHRKFLDACRASGLTMSDYPFNTKDLAVRSLYRYIKIVEHACPELAANRYGIDAARHLKNTGIGDKKPNSLRPFQRVEFDGHSIDLTLTLTFKNQYGDDCTDTIERIWLLVIIDIATRVVLGYHISIASQYSSSDVLSCIRNSIEPNHIKTLTIPGLKYPSNGGFHHQVIPEAQWALWNEFSYDNAKANLAKIVTNRLTEIVGCSINPGPVNMPERRPFVERFFGLLEENGYHRLPITTGSNPSDPKRKYHEKMIKKYAMNVEELEQITAVLIANYNRTPHSGLGNLTPLEVMKQRVMKGMEPRVLPEDARREVGFFEMTAIRTIRGNLKTGKRPYITYEGVTYRNELLSSTFDLIGTQIILLVNTQDIRFLKAFLKDGSEIGYVTASGRWGITPHTLQMRKQVNALYRKRLLHYTNLDDPVEALQHYLESKAIRDKKSRTKLAAAKRYLDQNKDDAKQAKEEQTSCSRSNAIQSHKTKRTEEELASLRKKFKTINI